MKVLVNFITEEEGASFAEYALLLSVLIVVTSTVVIAFGDRIVAAFTRATEAIQ